MNFKEQLKEDIKIFLNLDEFGEEITIKNILELWKDLIMKAIRKNMKEFQKK